MTNYKLEPISCSLRSSNPVEFSESLGNSFLETGFALIADHEIPQDVIDENLQASMDFFALPASVKATYDSRHIGGQRGYTAFGTENAKDNPSYDLKEFWHTGPIVPDDPKLAEIMPDNVMVKEVENFDKATRAMFEAMTSMCRKLLSSVALFLGLEEDWFDNKTRHANSILRLLHYPAMTTPPEPGSMRAAAHEDINLITILTGAEEKGLQAKHRSGQWLDINPPEGVLVVNVGDMLQRLTGGILPSTTHRVLNPSPERAAVPRYSTPFFMHFDPDYLIETLPECIEKGGSKFDPILTHDYLFERLREIGLVK